jgi:hypothetical protein
VLSLASLSAADPLVERVRLRDMELARVSCAAAAPPAVLLGPRGIGLALVSFAATVPPAVCVYLRDIKLAATSSRNSMQPSLRFSSIQITAFLVPLSLCISCETVLLRIVACNELPHV